MNFETLETRRLLADATLVKDLLPGADSGSALETTQPYYAVIGSKMLFIGLHPTLDRQVFLTDGTAAGTAILPGVNAVGDASPRQMVSVGAKAYFVVDDGGPSPGPNIWVTEGTLPTTRKLTALSGVSGSTGVNGLGYANGNVFFEAGGKLYKTTDAAGHSLVSGSFSTAGERVLGVGNTFFFIGRDAANGSELWASDGNSAHLVADIKAGDGDSAPDNFVAFKSKLFFTAHNAIGSRHLYSSDGTSANFVGGGPMGADAFPFGLTVVGDKLFFLAKTAGNYQIWVTDGTTRSVVTSFTGTPDLNAIRDMVNVNGTLFFSLARTGVTRRLYKLAAGTTATPVGPEDGGPDGGTQPGRLTAVASTVFFNALDKSSVARLFQSDGNTITLVKGDAGTDPSNLVNVNGTLIFNGNDGRGQELHAVIGTGQPDKPKFTVRLKAFEENIGTSDGQIDEGASIVFQAIPSEDIKGSVCRWDFDGNGSFVPAGKKPLHRYIDNLPGDAVRNVRVKVTAPDGRVANRIFPLVVKNVKPTIKVTLPPVTSPSASTPALISVSDPGENDELKVDIDWRDGTVQFGQLPIGGVLLRDHVYQEEDAIFGNEVRFSVHDKDGAQGVKKKAVRVLKFVKIDPIQLALDFLPGYLIGGGAANNRVQIQRSASQPDPKKESLVVIIDNAIQQVINVDPATEVIQIFTGDGRDRVDVDADINTRFKIYGGADADTLRGGNGRDTLVGGGSSDSLDARGGKNTVKQ
ncbi:MAG: hypothetical protein H7Z14_00835 [Anaerolineae bacterium]|nr:hypothetical protein [Phycisphaerae bacterium]